MVYGMTWRAMAWYMVWPGVHGIVHSMTVFHGMVYVMAWRAWHRMWYGLVGIIWYILRLGGHGMVYGMA